MHKLAVVDDDANYRKEIVELLERYEDEFIETERIPVDKAVEMVMNNEIEDAKTQLLILKAAGYIKRLLS